MHPTRWKTLLAFAIIYLVWGSTYLAIRIGVLEVPPFLLAAMRFATAGIALYALGAVRGERGPRGREWWAVAVLALLIFGFDYGLAFWAEQRVPSGIAAVMLATIPIFMSLFEIIFLGTQKLTLRLILALLVGIAGVAAMVSRSFNLGGAPVDRAGALALTVSAITWSMASVLTRKMPLPQSKVMSAAAQMIVGGLMLAIVSAAFGEFRAFHPAAVSMKAWLSLLYMIVFGSIIAYTAYVWLLHHESPTKVGTYAYVNPVVAVIVGYFLGGEEIGTRTIIGTACVLVSVLVITTMKKPVVRREELAVRSEAAD